jgi:uncharacterized protein YbaR (Trm112 family)
MLVCPSSKQALREVPLAVARDAVAGGSPLVPADRGSGPPAVGETPSVLLRDDGAVAFPVLDGTPVLMWPEVLTAPARPVTVDLRVPRYAEAYAEMGYYGDKASGHLADVTRTHI